MGPELSDSVALVIAKDVFPLKIDHLVGGSFDSKKKAINGVKVYQAVLTSEKKPSLKNHC